MRRIFWILILALMAFDGPMRAGNLKASDTAASPEALTQSSAEFTPIARHSPAQPKWGDTLELVYDPAAPNAAFALGDEVYAIYNVSPGSKQGWIKLEPRDGVLAGSLPIEQGAGYLTLYFITREGWDSKAGLGIMVNRKDGKPARGAYHQEMLSAFSPDSYLSLFEKERSLYPDNYAIFRDKWFMENFMKKGEIEAIVKKELPVLEKAAARKATAELLFAQSYGNLLLGREEAAREILGRLSESFPGDFYTGYALSDYDYQAFSGQWKGEGPEAVRKLALGLIARNANQKEIRRLFEKFVMDEGLSLETSTAVCRAWIRDEAENPLPYYYLALAAKSKKGDMKEAESMISRALALLLRGNLRLYGDIGGKMILIRMPAFFALRAELRRELGDLSDALADIKAAQGLS